jgi:uncharacterized protein
MSLVFVDTSYYLALLSSADQHHESACAFTIEFGGRFVTSRWVLAEVGNAMRRGRFRELFADLVADLRTDKRVRIVGDEETWFERGLDLFTQRPDKDWSLTDCISFEVMREEGLADALTADRHFEQAGFNVLLG